MTDSIEMAQTFPAQEFVQVTKISCEHRYGLANGDTILKYEDNIVTKMSDLSDMFTESTLRLSIVRNRAHLELRVPTIPVSYWQSMRVIWFAGLTIGSPYSPIPLGIKELPSRLYITHVRDGSPGQSYGLVSRRFLTHINGIKIFDFEDFAQMERSLPDDQYCQITYVAEHGYPSTMSLVPDRQGFPTIEASCWSDGWKFYELSRA